MASTRALLLAMAASAAHVLVYVRPPEERWRWKVAIFLVAALLALL